MTPRRLLTVMLLMSLLADLAGRAVAAPTIIRPERLVHHFDFEERKHGNFEDLPMHWYVIGRPAQTSDPNFQRQALHQALISKPGFPAYTSVRFDSQYARSGEFSFHLGLDGGNAGAFLEVGTLPAVPASDYLITAAIRTHHLERATARIVGYFIDANGRPLPESRVASEPIGERHDWTGVTVKLPGDFTDAAWIGLELELLQPTADPDHPLGRQQVVLEDVTGGAWFDDISVWQLPRVEVNSQSPVNVIRAPARPRYSVDIRDLTGKRLRAELTIYDHLHRPVAETTRQVGAGEPMNWHWTPDLPRFGWYLADLQVHEDIDASSAKGPVARTVTALLWLPAESALFQADRHRFALSAQDLPMAELNLLPGILQATRLEATVLSAWARDTTLQTVEQRQERLDPVLRELLARGRAITLSLHPVPTELAQKSGVGTPHPLSVLASNADHWLPYLSPVLMRQGQRIRRWQLGQAHDAEAFLADDLPGLLSAIHQRFSELAPSPQLVLPWRLDQSRRPELSENLALAMDVSPGVMPQYLPAHLEAWQEAAAEYWLHLHEPPADEVAHARRVTDLALRMIHGWKAEAGGLVLPRPWTGALDRRDAIWPDPLLGVFSNVAQRLAGRSVIGELPMKQGMQALILDGPSGGMIVAWNESADRPDAVLDLYLGESPTAIDVWGNRTSLAAVNGRHRVPLTQTPMFIEGIDPELALLRASFRVTPSFVEALQRPHRHEVVMRNPWQRTISGSLLFTGPETWTVQPVRHSFSLSPGQEMRLPVELTFPFAELAGPKQFTARAEFTADVRYQIDLSAPVKLGLPDIDFHPTVALEVGSAGGVVNAELVCVVTNTGEGAASLSVFANLPGHPRQERPIANLQPGQSVVRRFTFRDVDVSDPEVALRVGIREVNGPAVLNQRLPMHLR